MIFETCPMLNDIPWIKHGFFGIDNPYAMDKTIAGVHRFNNDYPNTLLLKQIHSDIVIVPPCGTEQEADASITDQSDLALAVKTADCCPVLLVCTHSHQIAAIHAGWPGALNQIAAKTARQLIQQGAIPESILAAIGPHIQHDSMTVKDDVRDQFMAQQPDKQAFFTVFEDRWKMNTAGIVSRQLQDQGISQIWVSNIDTFTNPDYASYRRHKQQNTASDPRNISLIMKA